MSKTPTRTFAVGQLNGRPSASMDATRQAAIERDLALTPRERVLEALRLGVEQRERLSRFLALHEK